MHRISRLFVLIIVLASAFLVPLETALSAESCGNPGVHDNRLDGEAGVNNHCTSQGNPLIVNGVCNGPDLEITILNGDGPFNLTATAGQNMPVIGAAVGTTTILGPEKWDGVTISETSGNAESFTMGMFKCRTDERPNPQTPAHRARLTTPNPTFTWSGISIARRYRIMLFDDKVTANRTIDIRQNTGGAETQLTLLQSLPVGRYFWRVRGRQNRVWSLWSVRFTLFIDPASIISMSTPVPVSQIEPTVPAPPIGAIPPDSGPPPQPTDLPSPPNSR